MKAAIVRSYGSAPVYGELPAPAATTPDEAVLDVLASALHPRVRSQAAGTHYTSTGELPLVPGVDGVGRGPAGELRYFVLPDTTLGAMAEQTVVDLRRSVVLPDGTDVVAVAAAMNPAMSSWVALRHRAAFEAGRSVLVLGATGSAGRIAVQVAKLFGAERIVAVARDAAALEALRALGATQTVVLRDDDALARAGADVDVVLDYLWGEPAAGAMRAIVPARTDDAQLLTWVQIGSVAGADAPVPSAALRATNLRIVGSGQGSVGVRQLLGELPGLAEAITAGSFSIGPRAVPLADVGTAWNQTTSDRLVLVP